MNLLFVCSKNRKRSPTAEAVFSDRQGVIAIGAGIDSGSATVLSGDLIEWADVVLFMEEQQRRRANRRFGDLLHRKRVLILGIPDSFEKMEPELIEMLQSRVGRLIELPPFRD